MNKTYLAPKIKSNDNSYAVKVRTESNGLGVIKTLIVLLLIAVQAAVLVLTQMYLVNFFRGFAMFSVVMTIVTCIYVLSSDFHGQAKATWILFLLGCFGFGYIFYFMSDKRIVFAKERKHFAKIFDHNKNLLSQNDLSKLKKSQTKSICNYLYQTGNFRSYFDSKTTYYPSGAKLFDEIIHQLKQAKKFIFIEFFIIADGVLLNRILDILKQKSQQGVDVRIIYDDMGSHKTLKRKTKKAITKEGIKLQAFNRLVPIFNIALNLRDHRKIVIIDGKVGFTGGTNLADEYINEKRMHGYWKDSGVKIVGPAVDNLTVSYLAQWEFLTNKPTEYTSYLNLATKQQSTGVVVPFVSGPNYEYSIAQNMYANMIGAAQEKLYIMTPYFIPDETLTNLIANKARSGVDVRIVIPEIADKKFVYVVSRNNLEKMLSSGVKVYAMKSSFVHSKIVLTENSCIIGSINVDLRSFNQQFESAVFTDEPQTLVQVEQDFVDTIDYSISINDTNKKRNSLKFRMYAGLFNIISPFM